MDQDYIREEPFNNDDNDYDVNEDRMSGEDESMEESGLVMRSIQKRSPI